MKNEKIWCIEKSKLFNEGYFHGYVNHDISFNSKIVSNKKNMNRSLVETNEDYKQPITYIVIMNVTRDKVFGYIRQGNEDRLTDKWSFGFGGHINQNDLTFVAAVAREVEEELDIEINDLVVYPAGYINLDNSPVNRVHFGLVYKAVIREDYDLKLRGFENKSGMWLSADDLDSMQFEDWSEIIKPVVKDWLSQKK